VINITWDQGFKRIYKKKSKNDDELKKNFWKSLESFSTNPFNPVLKTHKLTGRLNGLWAFSVSYDCRVIFQFLGDNEILLIDIGSHEEVY